MIPRPDGTSGPRQPASALLAVLLAALVTVPVHAQDDVPTGNVVFFHPDGSGLNQWNAARMYWYGPDGLLHWDRLPEMAVYRGHMRDRLVGTSNGGATVHAYGYKVLGAGSFGQDGGGDGARSIDSLSGFEGSLMREAAAAGHPVGVVNDGDVAEPGTGAFLAEVDDRGQSEEVVRQFLDGRPGFEGEPLPKVILGGGEGYFLSAGTPPCGDRITLECHVHVDHLDGSGPSREDGRNLLAEAHRLGYEVVRTRAEFEALWRRILAEPDFAPLVLGLFARDDIFNATTEEELIARGMVDEGSADSRAGRLITWGGPAGTHGHRPPTAAEMTAMALELLQRHSQTMGRPFYLVAEVESTDNLANDANAIGTLRALKAADDTIGVVREFIATDPDTLLLTAADSDAGGMQVLGPPPSEGGSLVDGIEGRGTAPFIAAPDAFGEGWEFAVGWAGTDDVAGAIVSRAEGLNAGLLRTLFSERFDSTDVYRMQYLTLFGELLPDAYGRQAPTRSE